jgi:GT2 family glycosyltransferase
VIDVSQPKIDVRIAYEPGGRLGADCNRIMDESVHDWVLFVDHDVYLALNPNWYTICQQAIDAKPDAGVFTCFCNNENHKYGQHFPKAPKANNIADHIEMSEEIYRTRKHSYTRLDHRQALFFLLVSKAAWERTEGFPGRGMFREDWDFCRRVLDEGFPIYRIDGLYVYHGRFRTPSLISGQKTTAEHWKDHKAK